jgi:TRAP transporter TAXI family solute receptor
MPRFRLSNALLAVVVSLLVLAPAASAQSTRLSIATGGTGGVYYPYGGALANLLSDNLEDTEVTAEATAASVDNMYLIDTQDADIVFVLADTAFDAVNGSAPFEAPINGMALATLYNNYTQIVVNDDAGIASLADLEGKRVSVGSPGSGTEVIANRILEASGIDPQEGIERDQLGAAESADALRDGNIDAFFWSGGLPTAAITDLASTPNLSISLLPHGEVADALLEAYGPFYGTEVIPAETYPTKAKMSKSSWCRMCWSSAARWTSNWPTTLPASCSRARPTWLPPIRPPMTSRWKTRSRTHRSPSTRARSVTTKNRASPSAKGRLPRRNPDPGR